MADNEVAVIGFFKVRLLVPACYQTGRHLEMEQGSSSNSIQVINNKKKTFFNVFFLFLFCDYNCSQLFVTQKQHVFKVHEGLVNIHYFYNDHNYFDNYTSNTTMPTSWVKLSSCAYAAISCQSK